MINFNKKILIIGFGSVSRCTVPVLFKHINVDYTHVTIVDFEDIREKVSPWTELGVRYINHQITPDNLAQTLSTYVAEGDLIIDLAWNIDCCEILQWCHDHDVLYVNTSVEVWDPYEGAVKQHPTERTLYWRHMNIRRMTSKWQKKGVTAVLEHGANPGLISHFTKEGLLDIANAAIAQNKVSHDQAKIIKELAEKRIFNELAMELGVKVIHCSERDTQISDVPKQVDEFVNTWSVEGFREEGMTTAEMGWGTHEKELPKFAFTHLEGPQNQICLARMGMNTWVHSWVPDYNINGMVVRHGEAFTISEYLSVYKDGQAIYRPTVHYAYCPSDAAIISLHELRGYDYRLQPNFRIMNDEIIKGSDILGALLMGHAFNSWWTGSNLSIEQSRALVPHQNATTVQVAISVVAACMWMIENPDRGVVVPDDIDHEYILGIAKPWLGNFISKASDWTPLKTNTNHFPDFNILDIDETDPWQFKNFLIPETNLSNLSKLKRTGLMVVENLKQLALEHGTPLFVVDHDVLRANYREFKQHLPRVQAYFAVKANSAKEIVKTFYDAGASFDVASMPEFLTVYENIKNLTPEEQQNFIWDKIIYANPIKPIPTLKELDQYKPLVTFDNENELAKIATYAPNAGLVLRIKVPNTGAMVELSSKFGADPGEAVDLIEKAFKRGLVVEGLSFHVGSQCTNFQNYVQALNLASNIFKESWERGYKEVKILDIGGGFPAPYDKNVRPFAELAVMLNSEFDRLFPPDIEIIAEPGRFLVATAAWVVMEIIGKAYRDGKKCYYVNDGVYHTFSGIIFDHCEYLIKSFKEGNENMCAVYGPTCDALDTITMANLLPIDLSIGDLLYSENIGAYSHASSTYFNGFPPAKVLHINR